MSSRPALDVASAPRVFVLDGEREHEVFDVLSITDELLRVRSPLLFEVGEELQVRVEASPTSSNVTVRVRAHIGSTDARVTELEILPATS